MSEQEEEIHYCFFCNIPSNNTQGNHVLHCSMCDKWMCDTCRPQYGMRMEAMLKGQLAAVNKFLHRG